MKKFWNLVLIIGLICNIHAVSGQTPADQPAAPLHELIRNMSVADYVSLQKSADSIPDSAAANLARKFYTYSWNNCEYKCDRLCPGYEEIDSLYTASPPESRESLRAVGISYADIEPLKLLRRHCYKCSGLMDIGSAGGVRSAYDLEDAKAMMEPFEFMKDEVPRLVNVFVEGASLRWDDIIDLYGLPDSTLTRSNMFKKLLWFNKGFWMSSETFAFRTDKAWNAYTIDLRLYDSVHPSISVIQVPNWAALGEEPYKKPCHPGGVLSVRDLVGDPKIEYRTPRPDR